MIPVTKACPSADANPLFMAVLVNNEEAVQAGLAANDSQRIPGTYLNCRDVIYRQWLSSDRSDVAGNDRKQRIYRLLCHTKLVKDMKKLAVHGNIDVQKAYQIFASMIAQEVICKLQMERNVYAKKASASSANQFYYTNFDPNNNAQSILKDKADEDEKVCELEAFVYKLAWLMHLEDSFIPTKKVMIENPEKDPKSDVESYFKVSLQPVMNPSRYIVFNQTTWGLLISQQCVMKAILIQFFFGLGDSRAANLRYDSLCQEIVHFDLDFALLRTNIFFNSDLQASFYNCDLLLLPQSQRNLFPFDIACLKEWTETLVRRFPHAVSFFNRQHAKLHAKELGIKNTEESGNATKSMQNDRFWAWHERLSVMQNAVLELENGRIKTMLDYVLFCCPSKKCCIYVSLALAILSNRFKSFSNIITISDHIKEKGLRSTMRQYAAQGIPLDIFRLVICGNLLDLHHVEFLNVCATLPAFEKQNPELLAPLYEEEADKLCPYYGIKIDFEHA